jgi:hypothetical protein
LGSNFALFTIDALSKNKFLERPTSLFSSQVTVPFRKLTPFRTEPIPIDQAPGWAPASEHRNFWHTGLLLATSAALGGIAVAIWNRRTLAQMRQQPQPSEDETD